jgi:hypothetical protein
MRHRFLSVFCLGMLIAAAGQAHEPQAVPSQCLSANAGTATAATYRLTPSALRFRAMKLGYQGPGTLPSGPATDIGTGRVGAVPCKIDSCGIVDDWVMAERIARQVCASVAPTLAAGQVSTLVSAPRDFLSADHHKTYRFDDGDLVFGCYACPTAN